MASPKTNPCLNGRLEFLLALWGGPPGPQPAPWPASGVYNVSSYRRRLPHWRPWRLHGSLPPDANVTSGKAFVALDRLLDHARTGPWYLRQPGIAQLVIDALQPGQDSLRHYTLHAFVVLPNHVHLLITPHVEVPKLLRSLKGITTKQANQILGRRNFGLGWTGRPFCQEESYDHVVRGGKEFERTRGHRGEPGPSRVRRGPGSVSLVECWAGRSRPGGRLRPRGAAPPVSAGWFENVETLGVDTRVDAWRVRNAG